MKLNFISNEDRFKIIISEMHQNYFKEINVNYFNSVEEFEDNPNDFFDPNNFNIFTSNDFSVFEFICRFESKLPIENTIVITKKYSDHKFLDFSKKLGIKLIPSSVLMYIPVQYH